MTFPHPKNIVITGASSGIGAALATAYAGPGVLLGLLGRDRERLESTASACREKGATVTSASLDIRKVETLQAWLLAFDAQHPVDLLIANAGVTSHIGLDGKGELWEAMEQVIEINIKGAFATVFPMIGPMRSRGQGQIALVSSLGAYRGMPITPTYCASKAAVKSYGEALRGWLAPEGIGVSVICPGFVTSPMSDRFPAATPFIVPPQKAAKVIKRGLARNRACISFPFPLNLGTRLLALLPAFLAERILRFLRY